MSSHEWAHGLAWLSAASQLGHKCRWAGRRPLPDVGTEEMLGLILTRRSRLPNPSNHIPRSRGQCWSGILAAEQEKRIEHGNDDIRCHGTKKRAHIWRFWPGRTIWRTVGADRIPLRCACCVTVLN